MKVFDACGEGCCWHSEDTCSLLSFWSFFSLLIYGTQGGGGEGGPFSSLLVKEKRASKRKELFFSLFLFFINRYDYKALQREKLLVRDFTLELCPWWFLFFLPAFCWGGRGLVQIKVSRQRHSCRNEAQRIDFYDSIGTKYHRFPSLISAHKNRTGWGW